LFLFRRNARESDETPIDFQFIEPNDRTEYLSAH